jgi:serine/threonine protein kinase
MVNLAMIVDSPSAGYSTHHIVYELAAYNLDTFLTTLPENLRVKRNETAPPERTGSKNMWPGDLILESRNLADALDYLHNRLYNTSGISLSHNDIKPENILVFYPDSTDIPDRYPVGKWKIADFGISHVKNKHLHLKNPPSSTANGKLMVEETVSVSKTTPKRYPGRYTAPELEQQRIPQKTDGRKADIWSFGCVLSEIIAYAVKLDCETVKNFRTALEPPKLEPPCSRPARFYDLESKEVQPRFGEYLDTLPSLALRTPRVPDKTEWIESSVELVKKIVVTPDTDWMQRKSETHCATSTKSCASIRSNGLVTHSRWTLSLIGREVPTLQVPPMHLRPKVQRTWRD